MALRQEFVTMVQQDTVTVSEVCRRFRVSHKTGYKWLARLTAEGAAGLTDHSRWPHGSPWWTRVAMETAVVALRDAHPTWGGRKRRRRSRERRSSERL